MNFMVRRWFAQNKQCLTLTIYHPVTILSILCAEIQVIGLDK
jgi:hypothetical protein